VRKLLASPSSPAEYYRSVFPRVYRESEEQWNRLKELEAKLSPA
jgi:hypothetical protein